MVREGRVGGGSVRESVRVEVRVFNLRYLALALCFAHSVFASTEEIVRADTPVPGNPSATLGSVRVLSVSPRGEVLLRAFAPRIGQPATTSAIVQLRSSQLTVVAREGDSDPTNPSRLLGAMLDAHINDAGDVVVVCNTTDLAGVQTGIAIIARTEVVWRSVQRTGDAATGIAGVNIGAPIGTVVGSADGSIIWRASLTGPGISAANNIAWFAAAPGGTAQLVAQLGGLAPAFGPAARYQGFNTNSPPQIANAGIVALQVIVSGSTGTTRGILHGVPGALVLALREGAPVPGVPQITSANGVFSNWTLADDGTLALQASDTTTGIGRLVVGTPAGFVSIAAANEQIPGLPAGYAFSGLVPANYPPSIAIGAGGHVVFGSLNTRTPTTLPPIDYSLHARLPDGSLALVAAQRFSVVEGEPLLSIVSQEVAVDGKGNVTFRALTGTNFPGVSRVVHWSPTRGLQLLASAIDGTTQLSVNASAFGEATGTAQRVTTFDGRVAISGLQAGVGFARLDRPRFVCGDLDFNNNFVFPEDADILCFFEVLAGGSCDSTPAGLATDRVDFNNNDVFPEDNDILDFFNVLAGGNCE